MFYIVYNLALESSAESFMQFLDSDANFVLSCSGFVRFCLFGFLLLFVILISQNSKAYM